MTPDVDRRTAVSSSHLTPRWRRESRANSSLKPPKFPASGENTAGARPRRRSLQRSATNPGRRRWGSLESVGLLMGDRGFESTSLQQRVRCELDFLTGLNGSAGRPTEILSQVGAMLAGPAALCRPRRERSLAHPRGKPGFLTHEDKVARETVPRLRRARCTGARDPRRHREARKAVHYRVNPPATSLPNQPITSTRPVFLPFLGDNSQCQRSGSGVEVQLDAKTLPEGVLSEPVSEPKFPASWGKYREFCSSRPPRAQIAGNPRTWSMT
jgi:hypothetical protein